MSGFDVRGEFLQERCTGCGICSRVCPVSAVVTGPGGRVESFSSICIGCGHCGAHCPGNCWDLEPLEDQGDMPLARCVDWLFASRRSVRVFGNVDLPDAVIDEMLSPVGLSPTGHNDQGLRVTVVSGADRVRGKLVRPVLRLLALVDCFRLVTLLSGKARPMVRRLHAGEDLLAWGAPCVLFFHAPLRNVTGSADTVIAAVAVEMKARAMGLGTLWNGVLKILSPLLGMGRSGAVLCVGYPAVRNRWKLPERRWTRRQPG